MRLYNKILCEQPPFFRHFGSDLIRDVSSFPFIVEEIVAYGAVEIAIPAMTLSSFAIDSLQVSMKKRIKLVDKDGQSWRQVIMIQQPFFEEFGLKRSSRGYGRAVIHQGQISPIVEKAILCLEVSLYPFLLGFRYGLQIDVDIQAMASSLETLSKYAKNPLSRTYIAVLKGLLSTYEDHKVHTLITNSTADNRILELFEDFIHDDLYKSVSSEFYNLGFPQKVKRSLCKIGRLVKRLVAKPAFRQVVDFGSRTITAATNIPTPKSELAESLLRKGFLPPTISLSPAMEKARNAWEESGVDFRLLNLDERD